MLLLKSKIFLKLLKALISSDKSWLVKKYKVGNFFSTFFVAHVLIFFHFSTRFPHSLFKNFSQKFFKRAQTMLQSWLNSRTVSLFIFLNYPVFKNYKFLNPPLQRRGILWTFKTLKTIDARFARAKKNKSFAPLELTKTSTIFSLQTFCSYGTIFPEVKLLKNFKQTLSTLWQTWKTSCYKNFTKNFTLLRKTNSVNLQIS